MMQRNNQGRPSGAGNKYLVLGLIGLVIVLLIVVLGLVFLRPSSNANGGSTTTTGTGGSTGSTNSPLSGTWEQTSLYGLARFTSATQQGDIITFGNDGNLDLGGEQATWHILSDGRLEYILGNGGGTHTFTLEFSDNNNQVIAKGRVGAEDWTITLKRKS